MAEPNAPEVKEGLCVNCGEHERYHMPAGRACMCNRDMYYAPTLDHPNAIARRSPAVSELRAAATALYMAGRWTAGLPNEAAMWERLRDALGMAPGTATAAGVHERPAVSGEVERLAEGVSVCLLCSRVGEFWQSAGLCETHTREAAEYLAAVRAGKRTAEYVCRCGIRVVPHRCGTGEEF